MISCVPGRSISMLDRWIYWWMVRYHPKYINNPKYYKNKVKS